MYRAVWAERIRPKGWKLDREREKGKEPLRPAGTARRLPEGPFVDVLGAYPRVPPCRQSKPRGSRRTFNSFHRYCFSFASLSLLLSLCMQLHDPSRSSPLNIPPLSSIRLLHRRTFRTPFPTLSPEDSRCSAFFASFRQEIGPPPAARSRPILARLLAFLSRLCFEASPYRAYYEHSQQSEILRHRVEGRPRHIRYYHHHLPVRALQDQHARHVRSRSRGALHPTLPHPL